MCNNRKVLHPSLPSIDRKSEVLSESNLKKKKVLSLEESPPPKNPEFIE